MTLNQALALIKTNLIRAKQENGRKRPVYLVYGFQPLHLATFLRACQAERQEQDQAEVLTGLYGDVGGNLARAADSGAVSAAVVIEWGDVDPRLGLRASAGRGSLSRKDICASAAERLKGLANGIGRLAARMPLALLGPALPLPPIDSTIGAQTGSFELELRLRVADFLLGAAEMPGVRIVQPPAPCAIDRSGGEWAGPLDPRMELLFRSPS